MDLNSAFLNERLTYHNKMRAIDNKKIINLKRRILQNEINILAIKTAISNLSQGSIHQLLVHLKDQGNINVILSGQEVEIILTVIQNLNYVPYQFISTLFAKIDQTSQKALLIGGLSNTAIFVPIQQIMKNLDVFELYLLFISKIMKPCKTIKQYFFSKKIIPIAFKLELHQTHQQMLSQAFKSITKFWKISSQDSFYSDFLQSFEYMLALLQDATQGLVTLCGGIINVLRYKDSNVLNILIKQDFISKCFNKAKNELTIIQISSLNSVINTLYLSYTNNQRVKKDQLSYLLQQFYPSVLQFHIALVNQNTVSETTKNDIYFVLDYLISQEEYTKIICSIKMFCWICQRIPKESQVSERQLQNVLKLLYKFLRSTVIQAIKECILEQKLMQQLLQILQNQRWDFSLKIVIFYILSQVLSDKILASNFKRIPNQKIVIDSVRDKCTQPIWESKLQQIQYLLESENEESS